MTKIQFVGDIMLGRNVAQKFKEKPYDLISEEVINKLAKTDVRIANLESPITSVEDDDSLKFGGNKEILQQFSWVDCFSLSNNHINDFGHQGMMDTISNLKRAGINNNGLYKETYEPFIIEKGVERIAVIMCTDMMNIEFANSCPYKTLRVNEPDKVAAEIHRCKEAGFFTILFAHIGMLFSRFPNPPSREFLHKMVDEGADCIVTAHSHCIGCHEEYKGVHIFHSLGDFLMDGASFRRRTAYILSLEVKSNRIVNWSIQPTQTTMELQVVLPENRTTNKIVAKFEEDSLKMATIKGDFRAFYKREYRKDMLSHSLSTLHFELKRRGLKGLIHILKVRSRDVFGMMKRMVTDRSNMAYDTDGVDTKHKMSNKDIQ